MIYQTKWLQNIDAFPLACFATSNVACYSVCSKIGDYRGNYPRSSIPGSGAVNLSSPCIQP
jgi:hypothetical protein